MFCWIRSRRNEELGTRMFGQESELSWLDLLAEIEDLEDAEIDAALVAQFESAAAGHEPRSIRFSTPTFKEYETTELSG